MARARYTETGYIEVDNDGTTTTIGTHDAAGDEWEPKVDRILKASGWRRTGSWATDSTGDSAADVEPCKPTKPRASKQSTQVIFKRDADGVWGILCPVDKANPGTQVEVTKRDGTTKIATIATVADYPKGDGRIFCWLRSDTTTKSRPARRNPSGEYTRFGTRRHCITDGNCSSFGTGESCGAPDCDGY